jgi:hypothetical protein
MRQALFYRHVGPWMLNAVERIITRFKGRIVTGREAADGFLRRGVRSVHVSG